MGAESWTGIGSTIASLFFLYSMVKNYIPLQLRDYVAVVFQKVLFFIKPYANITIQEYCGERMKRDELYTAAQAYLSSTCSSRAGKLKAELGRDSDTPLVTIGDNVEVLDSFKGVKIRWFAGTQPPKSQTISFYPGTEESKYVILIIIIFNFLYICKHDVRTSFIPFQVIYLATFEQLSGTTT